MWPLYLLFNKFLKTEEENVHEADEYPKDLAESYSLEQLPSDGKCPNVIVPHSHCVDVSVFIFLSPFNLLLEFKLLLLHTLVLCTF